MNKPQPHTRAKLPIGQAGREPIPSPALDRAIILERQRGSAGITALLLQWAGINIVSAMTEQAVEGKLELTPTMTKFLTMAGLGSAIIHGRRPYQKNEEPVDDRYLVQPKAYDLSSGMTRPLTDILGDAHNLFNLATSDGRQAITEHSGDGVSNDTNRNLTQRLGNGSLLLWASAHPDVTTQGQPVAERSIKREIKRYSRIAIASTRAAAELPTLMSLADPLGDYSNAVLKAPGTSVQERQLLRDLRDSQPALQVALQPHTELTA